MFFSYLSVSDLHLPCPLAIAEILQYSLNPNPAPKIKPPGCNRFNAASFELDKAEPWLPAICWFAAEWHTQTTSAGFIKVVLYSDGIFKLVGWGAWVGIHWSVCVFLGFSNVCNLLLYTIDCCCFFMIIF